MGLGVKNRRGCGALARRRLTRLLIHGKDRRGAFTAITEKIVPMRGAGGVLRRRRTGRPCSDREAARQPCPQ